MPHPLFRKLREKSGLQRMMDYWEGSAPYNEVNLVEVDPRLTNDILSDRWRQILSCLGFDPTDPRYIQVDSLSESDQSQWLTDNLNEAFLPEGCPLRLTVLRTQDQCWWLYCHQHQIGDGWTSALVIKRLLGGECPGAATRETSSVSARSMWQAVVEIWRQIWSAGRPRWDKQRSGTRIHMAANRDLSVSAIKAIAKQQNATVNDLLVAASVDALNGVKPEWTNRRRPNLLVQIPVSTRDHEHRFEFGQHLGTWSLSVPAGSMMERLQAVRATTSEAKAGPHAGQTDTLVGAAERLLRLFPRNPMISVGRWAVPVAGFISNLNLTGYFHSEAEQGLLRRFTRAVSPCDFSPVTLTATGFGSEMNIRATAWDAYLNQSELQLMVNGVATRMASFS